MIVYVTTPKCSRSFWSEPDLRSLEIRRCVFLSFLGRCGPGGVTVSSGKSTDVTCKTHLGYLSAQLP